MAGCGVLITFVFFIYIVSWDRSQLVGLSIPLRSIAKASYARHCRNINVACNAKQNRIMNQEYIQQTVKKLVWLSDSLISEMDSTSDNYFGNHMKFIFARVKKIISRLDSAKGLKTPVYLTSELWIDPWLYRQLKLSDMILTDPFLPKQIREKVSKFYSKKVNDMTDVYGKVMGKFCSDLFKGKIKDLDFEIQIQTWAKLGEGYRQKGWDWEKTQIKIEELRGDIEKYLLNLK